MNPVRDILYVQFTNYLMILILWYFGMDLNIDVAKKYLRSRIRDQNHSYGDDIIEG